MAFAQGSRHQMSYVAETVFGATPGTPSMKALRVKGHSLNLTKESYTSGEIRPDRAIADMRHGARQIGGEISAELSYAAFDDLIESLMFSSWSSDQIKTGATLKSFTFESGMTDNGDYRRFTGCVVNSLALAIPASGIVEATFGVVGKGLNTAAVSLGAPSVVASHAALAAVNGTLTEGGATFLAAQSIQLNIDNGVTPNFVVGSNETPQLSYGRANITGTLAAFVEDLALLDKFVNETESSLVITLGDDEGNEIEINLPRIKYSAADLPLDGEGSLSVTLPFQALYDSGEASSIVIVRTAA